MTEYVNLISDCSHTSFSGLLILHSLKCIRKRGRLLLLEIGIHKNWCIFKGVQKYFVSSQLL